MNQMATFFILHWGLRSEKGSFLWATWDLCREMKVDSNAEEATLHKKEIAVE